MRLSQRALGGLEVWSEGEHSFVGVTEVVSARSPTGYLDLVRDEVRLGLGGQLVLALARDYRIVGKPEFSEDRRPSMPYLLERFGVVEPELIEMRGRCEVAKP